MGGQLPHGDGLVARDPRHRVYALHHVRPSLLRAPPAGGSASAHPAPGALAVHERPRPLGAPGRVPRPERRSPEQVSCLERLRQADADSAVADDLTQGFLLMVWERRGDLDAWMTAAVGSEVAEVRRFARGLRDDAEAVQAGLTLVHSNGQTEGFINKLKLTKRSMYGCGRFDLLRQRVLRAA